MDNIKQRVADRIREARKAANLTQKELGEKMGLSDVTITHYENGKQNLTIGTLEKLANALQVSVADLVK